ncbi:MAG: hypothetical protein ABI779_09985 [Acidobacteriota bacterium]
MSPVRTLLLILPLLGTIARAATFAEPVRLTPSPATEVALAYTTDGPLVVWRNEAGTLIARAAGGSDEHLVASETQRIAVAAIGRGGLAVWTQTSGAVMVVRLTGDGVPSGAIVRLASNAAGAVTVAASEDRYFVAWLSNLGEVYSALLDSSAGIQVPAMAASTQSLDSIDELRSASSGDGFAVVWHRWSPTRAIHALTFDANGTPASLVPMVIEEDGYFPDVTWNASTYFVAWGDARGIGGRTLTPQRDLGRRVRVTGEEDVVPRIGWDGSAYDAAFVRYAHPRPGFSIPFMAAQRFRPSGADLENLGARAPLLPGSWDLDARDGRVDLVVASSDGVTLQTATVTTPPVRSRAVRH